MPRKSKPWWWNDRQRWATTIDGKRVTAPVEVVTEHDAWAWHAEVVADLTSKPVVKATMTVGDLLDAYAQWDAKEAAAGTRNPSTTRNDLSTMQAIACTRLGSVPFGVMVVSRLTPNHYDALLAAWRREGYKPNYAGAMARKLKTVLLWAARATLDRGPLLDESPFKGCKTPPAPASGERYGDRAMAARWLWFLWKWKSKPGKKGRFRRDALFQRCLIHTGARPSELAWATWGDVRWDAATDSAGNPMAIISREDWKNAKKSGKTRRIYLPARLVRTMRRRAAGKGPDDLIFPSPRGAKHCSAGISDRTRYLRRKAAGQGVVLVERNGSAVTNYVWRHSAASTLLMSGVDMATVAELLGTSVVQIQRTYGHLLEDHLAAASEKLGKKR